MIRRCLSRLLCLCLFVVVSEVQGQAANDAVAPFKVDFAAVTAIPAGWTVQGDISVVDGSLTIARSRDKFDTVTGVTTSPFALRPGMWDIGGAFRSEIESPDTSYNVSLTIESMDAAGKVIDRTGLGQVTGTTNRKSVRKTVSIPVAATQGRLILLMNKTNGRVWVQRLSATFIAPPKAPPLVERLQITHPREGQMLLPEDPRTFTITTWSPTDLPDDARVVSYVVRDYWGNNHGEPVTVNLEITDAVKEAPFVYRGTIDLSAMQLDVGRYYEIHARIASAGQEPVDTHSSFVVLPEAPSRKYGWKEIPFTSRNWDNRMPEYMRLSDRVGIRVVGVRSDWSATEPFTMEAPQLDLARSLNLGVLFRAPIYKIEQRVKGSELYTPEQLRKGVRAFWARYGGDDAMMFLGNEPRKTGDAVKEDVAAYQAVYEELKSISPNTFIIGTSVGNDEEAYFKFGFGQYLDAYDFHTYDDPRGISKTMEHYREKFAKFGHEKPIFSTEIGLNSQGLTRRTIAGDLIRKFAIFFAQGGDNASWFTICYPNRDGKLTGTAEDAFNTFDGLYGYYTPRLDAIAYYNFVNGLLVKKAVGQKTYGDDLHATLFRDADGKCMQVLWKDRDARDVFLPLPGVGDVKVTRIDGGISTLNAGGKGLTLRVGEDPVLLEFDGAVVPLAADVAAPPVTISSLPNAVVGGASSTIGLKLNGVTTDRIAVTAPPLWVVSPVVAGENGAASFSVTPPAKTPARFVPIRVAIKGGASTENGELWVPIDVRGELAVSLWPVINAGKPGAKLVIKNNGATIQSVEWRATVTRTMAPVEGKFDPDADNTAPATFDIEPSGSLTIAAGAEETIVLPLSGVVPQGCYAVRAEIGNPSQGTVVSERWMSGFAAAPKAASPFTIDGELSEADWSRATVNAVIDENQFRNLRKTSVWNGPADLSAKVRYAWDDRYFYMAAEVTDDIAGAKVEPGRLWAQDGLQLMIDPGRERVDKPGKFDYGMAMTNEGPKAWCFLSGNAGAPVGPTPDILVAVRSADDGTGSRTYEVAIPWSRLAPFKAHVGADLGLALAVNEDDGVGRDAFMSWFGDIQSKQVDAVGDILLVD